MIILFSILLGILATAAILGIGYLLYDAIQDAKQPPADVYNIQDVPTAKLRFKKPV